MGRFTGTINFNIKKEWRMRVFWHQHREGISIFFQHSAMSSSCPTQSHLSVVFFSRCLGANTFYSLTLSIFTSLHFAGHFSLIICLAAREALVKMFWFRRRAYIILLFLHALYPYAPERGLSPSRLCVQCTPTKTLFIRDMLWISWRAVKNEDLLIYKSWMPLCFCFSWDPNVEWRRF